MGEEAGAAAALAGAAAAAMVAAAATTEDATARGASSPCSSYTTHDSAHDLNLSPSFAAPLGGVCAGAMQVSAKEQPLDAIVAEETMNIEIVSISSEHLAQKSPRGPLLS